jgi:hypothetical protein
LRFPKDHLSIWFNDGGSVKGGHAPCTRCAAANRDHGPAVAIRNHRPLCAHCLERDDEIRSQLTRTPRTGRSIAECEQRLRNVT